MTNRIKDRFTKGLLAGITAAIAMNLVNLLTHNIFKITDVHILDFASILIHGSIPHSLGETVFALSGQIGFAGFMGIIFAYLLKYINDKNSMLKAIIFSLSIWFFTYAVTILFNKIKHIDVSTALSNLAATFVFGIVLSLVLTWLDKKVPSDDVEKAQKRSLKYYMLPSPAMKVEKGPKTIKAKKPFKIK